VEKVRPFSFLSFLARHDWFSDLSPHSVRPTNLDTVPYSYFTLHHCPIIIEQTTMRSLHRILLLAIVLIEPAPVLSAEGFGDGFGGQKNCPEFKCRQKDETPVPQTPMKLTSTGCSSIGGGGISMMGGGGNDEKVIAPCCDLYHACNQICGTTKSFCDAGLEKCMDATCNAIKNDDAKKKCEGNVTTKKLMLQFSQCLDFNQGQQQSCKCVKKNVVDEKRKEVVRSFYKKFNPANVDKADSLAAKASDSNKLGGLLFKLVAKYPKAIRRVQDPKQKMMEDMMNGGKFPDARGNGGAKKPVVDAKNDDDDDESDERIEL